MGKVGTPRAPDMMGFKTGWLTVVDRAGRIGLHATWVCKCVCGNKTIARTRDLRNGRRVSCGCARNKRRKLEPVIGVDPTVKFLFRQMNEQQASMEDVSKRAGVTAHCMTKWRRGETLPKLPDMRAALGALGFKLVIKGEE